LATCGVILFFLPANAIGAKRRSVNAERIFSLCAVGSVGVALCKLVPFVNPLASPQQYVLIAALYSPSRTLPALLYCSCSSALAAQCSIGK